MFYVYILYTEQHKRYYIGQTQNLENRIVRHNSGIEKSTAPWKPWELVLSLQKETRSEAMILEKKLKNLNTEDLKKFISKYSK
ncbi:MAG: GIY-YIG nuclease family protein [Bacteroidia bacterium]|nr:GIY-YIG nuclease family protein [Bacteroidia bacterium]